MFAIIGAAVVLVSMITGFTMGGGKFAALIHPAEIVTIVGIGIGSVIIANPLHIIMKILGSFGKIMKGSTINKQKYLDLMKMLYELFQYAKREGLIALESHIESPESSSIIGKYDSFLKNHHTLDN